MALGIATAASMAAPTTTVWAQAGGRVCVECVDPAETYECMAPDAVDLSRHPALRRGLKLICLTQIAETAGHRACKVRKTGDQRCLGTPFDLDMVLARGTAPDADGVAAAPNAVDAAGPSHQTSRQLAVDDAAQASAHIGPAPRPGVAVDGTGADRADGAGEAARRSGEQTTKGPPKTLQALAERTAETTGRQIEKTGKQISQFGKTVGDTVSQSVKCVATLFSDC